MSGSIKALYKGAKNATKKLEAQLIRQDNEIQKIAGEMLDNLFSEAQEKRTLNESYSVLMKTATTENARNKVHNFYAFATESISKVAHRPLILTDMGILDKTAGVINPSAKIIKDMNQYITLRAQRDKTAAMHEILSEKLSTFARNALEAE